MHLYFPLFTISFLSAVIIQIKYDIMYKLDWFWIALILVCVATNIIAYKLKKRKYVLCLLVGFCIGFAYTNIFMGYVHRPLEKLDGRKMEVTATIVSFADRYEDTQRVTCRVQTESLGVKLPISTFNTLTYLPLTNELLKPGDTIRGTFLFYRGTSNGGFDRSAYYDGQNYHILATLAEESAFQVDRSSKIPISLYPITWSYQLKESLSQRLDARSSSLLKALLFGDRDGLSIRDKQNLQKVGLSHVTAVSGMHVGFLVSFFVLVLGRRVGLGFSLMALIVFVPMAGASPSVIRATIMYAFVVVGFYARLEHSALHALCTALVLLLLYNPYGIYSVSLQLSFLSSLGLILFDTKLNDKVLNFFEKHVNTPLKKRCIRFVSSTITCTLHSLALTIPVLMHSFGYISVISVITNTLLIGVFSTLFILGFLLLSAGGISVIGNLLSLIITWLCSFVLTIAEYLGGWNSALLYWDQWHVKVVIVLTLGIITISYIWRKTIAFRYAAGAICTLVIISITVNAYLIQRTHSTTLLSCGGGQAITVAYGEDTLALIDCAASGYGNAVDGVEKYMSWNGFTNINLLILTAVDKTHAKNVPELLEKVSVQQIMIPPETRESELKTQILALAEKKNIPITIWRAEDERDVGDVRLGISVIGGVPHKLGVRVSGQNSDILVLHSMTPKMLQKLLVDQNITGDSLILSEQFLDNDKSIIQSLKNISPKQIYLQTSREHPDSLNKIPIATTKQEGDITLKFAVRRQ